MNDGWEEELEVEDDRRKTLVANKGASKSKEEATENLSATLNADPEIDIKLDGPQVGVDLLEDISDDEDYQIFRHRTQTIKKNLVKMATVTYEDQTEKR